MLPRKKLKLNVLKIDETDQVHKQLKPKCSWCDRNICTTIRIDKGEYYCCQCYIIVSDEWFHNRKVAESQLCTICVKEPIICSKCKCADCEVLDCYGLVGDNGIFCCNCYDERGPIDHEDKCCLCQEASGEDGSDSESEEF